MAILPISAQILDAFRMLQSSRRWDTEISIHSEDITTTQYLEEFQKYVDNEYYAEHRWLPSIRPNSILNNDLATSIAASRFDQSS